MGNRLVEKLDELSEEDTVEIYFSGVAPHEPGGVVIDSVLATTVERVAKQHITSDTADDSEQLVKKEIVLQPPGYDDVHEEYVIQAEIPETGEVKVSPVEAREYFDGEPGDGTYAVHQVGFTDIKIRE